MIHYRLTIASLALVLTACGGGSDAPAPTAVDTALTLNLQSPANFAAPALPAYYDTSVLAADNTPAADPIDDKIATLGTQALPVGPSGPSTGTGNPSMAG